MINHIVGVFDDPVTLAFRGAPLKGPLYRVSFLMSTLWGNVSSKSSDLVDVEIYQSWIESIDRNSKESHVGGIESIIGATCCHDHNHQQMDDAGRHDDHDHDHGHEHSHNNKRKHEHEQEESCKQTKREDSCHDHAHDKQVRLDSEQHGHEHGHGNKHCDEDEGGNEHSHGHGHDHEHLHTDRAVVEAEAAAKELPDTPGRAIGDALIRILVAKVGKWV